MPSNKFILPTGYENEQRKAEHKRKLAELMLEKGLTNNPNMQNWTQVLGQLASAYAGMRLDKKADALDSDVNSRMLADYTKRKGDFDTATGGGNVDPTAIVRRFSGDPMLEAQLKPYIDAMSHRLSQQEDIVKTPTTYARQGDLVGKPIFDPNAAVIPDGQGGFTVNPVRRTAALEAQGYGLGPAVESMPDPTGGGNPLPPAMSPPQAAGMADSGGLNLNLLSPEERQIMSAELARRAGQGGTATLQNNTHIPMGNPLTAQRAPAGVVNGKPYWLINGIPYDNPEGK
jgi:hypothetical protein